MSKPSTLLRLLLDHGRAAKEIAEKDWRHDRILRNALAMELFQAFNYFLSLVERYGDEKGCVAFSYSEFVECLAPLVGKDKVEGLLEAVRIRNRIAHEYYRFSDRDLAEGVKLLPLVEKVSSTIVEVLGEE